MFLNVGGEDPVRFIKPVEKRNEANKAFQLENHRSLHGEKGKEEDLESLFQSLLNEAPCQAVLVAEEHMYNPRINRWMRDMRLKPGQGLGKA